MTRVTALRRLGTLTAGLLLAAGLAQVPAGAAEGDVVATPTVGSCYDMTLKESDGSSVPRAAVDCSAAHTSEVIAVGTLPDGVTWDSAEKDIVAVVVPACGRAWNKVTGGKLLRQVRSQYDFVWFQPTSDEQALGARWFSCHIVARNDDGLAPLSHPLPKLTARTSDSVATCVTSSLDFTTRADRHAWRSSYAFYVSGKATKRTLNAAANRTCPRHVTSRQWLRNGITVSSKRFVVVCYSQTKH